MSKESMEWLNTMTLIGFSGKRGNAWHYREESQGDEPNHYVGAVPVEDVLRRLFNFTVREQTLYIVNASGEFVPVADRKAMVTDDTDETLGIFKSGFQGHDYKAWLIDNVGTILDSELGIGSAGLLKGRAQAWVSIEVPDTITTPEGVEFRPNLVACTSYDGSLATTYKRTVTNVVCDNTLSAGLSEKGQTFKVKHTKNSGLAIASARMALEVVHTIGDDFAAEVARLCAIEVSPNVFDRVMGKLVPIPDADMNKRGNTVATNKANTIRAMYAHDDRVAPWAGTAFGVLQAFNTYALHEASVRGGVHRAVRNMENVVTDKMANHDSLVLSTLNEVMA